MIDLEEANGGEPRRQRDSWQRVRSRLRAELGEEVFSCWFAGMNLESSDQGTVVLSVPSRFLKSWISTHYRDKLTGVFQSETGLVRKIDVTVRSAVRPKAEVTSLASARPFAANDSTADAIRLPVPERRPPARAANPGMAALLDECRSPLDPRFTFDAFVEGNSNRFALAAGRQVAEGGAVAFNPLYVHASVGLGKTHLLQAIAHEVTRRRPEAKALYLTAETFMYRFVQALQNQSALAFKEALRGIDLLIIDDMQFLHGKQVQQEFCHTVNALIDGAKQVVVAADRPPVELETLEERVRSRLSGGLLVEMMAPDILLRRQIVERRIAAVAEQHPAFTVPEEVLDFIVRNVTTNGRDLEGAITRLAGHNQLTGAPIALAMAEATLKDLIRANDGRRVKIEDIQRVAGKYYNVPKTELLSSRRTRAIVWPRQVAMYMSKTLTPRSLPEIGRRFGGRDHTTVLHAVRKVEERLNTGDEQLAQEIEIMKRMLES
jgi:chromosomal replication initiator protein